MSRRKGSTPPNKGKVMLTDKQMQWLIDNFADEDNFIIADTLGISESTMHRYARAHGLKKSKASMRRCQKEAANAARYFNKVSGRNAQLSVRMKNGGMSEKFLSCCFTKEDNMWLRCPEKMRAARKKGGQSLHFLWEEEKKRVRAGLPQRTNLNVADGGTVRDNRMRVWRRYYLRNRGYRIDGSVAFWNEDTLRSPRLEAKDELFKYRMEDLSDE